MLDPTGHKLKTAHNRASSASVLTEGGIIFDEKNNGAHLIVRHNHVIVDFWPGTGLWIARKNTRQRGRGVFNLIRFLRGGRG